MEEANSNLPPLPAELAVAANQEVLDTSQIIDAALARQAAGEATAEDQQLLAVFELGATFGAKQVHEGAGETNPIATPILSEDRPKTVEERTISGNLLDATEKRIADVGAKIDTKKGWGDDTSDLQTELQGHEDFRDYLMSRDYKDKKGNVHDAQTGSFKSPSQANAHDEEQSDMPEDLSVLKLQGQDGLLEKWAEAEDRDWSTVSKDVEDELLRRLDNEEGLSDEQKMAYIDRMHSQMTKLRETEQPPVSQEGPTPDTTEATTANGEVTEDTSPEDGEEQSVPTAPEIEGELAQRLDISVDAYATAKIASEPAFSGKNARLELEEAGNALKQVFNETLGAIPESMRSANQLLQNSIEDNQSLLQQAQERLTSIQAEIAKQADGYNGEFGEQVTALETEIQERQLTASDLQEKQEQATIQANEYMAQRVLELHKLVYGAVDEKKLQAKGKFGKMNNWLAKHPKFRIGMGLSLTALGFVGAASFNAPLVAIAAGGKALLRGVGSYEVTRGAGELLASRRLDRADMSTVENFLEASKRESGTLRNSKRLGTLIGAGMALGPLTYQIVEEASRHLNIGGMRPNPTNPTHVTTTQIPSEALNIQPVDGNTVPWTFGMNSLHTNLSSPGTLAKLVHNGAGIKFFGNGLGGGQGAITRVFIPGQGNFSDLGHINGAIQYVLGGKA